MKYLSPWFKYKVQTLYEAQTIQCYDFYQCHTDPCAYGMFIIMTSLLKI